MSYLLTGTAVTPVTQIFSPGIASKGQDFVGQFINGTGNLTTQAGVSQNVTSSIVYHNFSGTATYNLGVSGTSPAQVEVYDTGGKSAVASAIVNIFAPVGGTINGATGTTLATNFGKKTLFNYSGNAWIAQ